MPPVEPVLPVGPVMPVSPVTPVGPDSAGCVRSIVIVVQVVVHTSTLHAHEKKPEVCISKLYIVMCTCACTSGQGYARWCTNAQEETILWKSRTYAHSAPVLPVGPVDPVEPAADGLLLDALGRQMQVHLHNTPNNAVWHDELGPQHAACFQIAICSFIGRSSRRKGLFLHTPVLPVIPVGPVGPDAAKTVSTSVNCHPCDKSFPSHSESTCHSAYLHLNST